MRSAARGSPRANHVTSKGAVAAICVGMMLIVGLLSLWSLRRVAQIILGLVIIQLLAFVALGFILLATPTADFVSSFGSFSHNPNAYNDVLTAGSRTAS